MTEKEKETKQPEIKQKAKPSKRLTPEYIASRQRAHDIAVAKHISGGK